METPDCRIGRHLHRQDRKDLAVAFHGSTVRMLTHEFSAIVDLPLLLGPTRSMLGSIPVEGQDRTLST